MQQQIKPGSFADGIRKLNTKGALIIPVRLTKKRARILIDMVGEYKYLWHSTNEGRDDNDMQAAMQWIVNQINRRWSQNELYTD